MKRKNQSSYYIRRQRTLVLPFDTLWFDNALRMYASRGEKNRFFAFLFEKRTGYQKRTKKDPKKNFSHKKHHSGVFCVSDVVWFAAHTVFGQIARSGFKPQGRQGKHSACQSQSIRLSKTKTKTNTQST